MATEAELGGACRLADGSASGRTAIGRVGGRGHRVIPERQLAGTTMGRVAEDANTGFCGGFNWPRPGNRKIVLGIEDGVAAHELNPTERPKPGGPASTEDFAVSGFHDGPMYLRI